MTTTTRDTSETSVTFSLAELAKIEEERVREEEQKRLRSREREARERRDAEEKRRAAEAAEVAAQAEAQAKRRREEAEAKARAEAREQAAAEIARIEAASKARLDAENAARAHELALLRVKTEANKGRAVIGLAVALGLSILGGGVFGFQTKQKLAEMEARAERLDEGRSALSREREQARSTELASLDKRFATLRSRLGENKSEVALTVAEAARAAIDPKALDHHRMRTFGEALDALQAKIEAREKITALDRRYVDLGVWAAQQRKQSVLSEAEEAGKRAKATTDVAAIAAYERALDGARRELGQGAKAASGAIAVADNNKKTAGVCQPGDPGCGLDGKPLF